MSAGEADLSADDPRAQDLDWLRRAGEGDAAAFRSLVDRHSAGLFRICSSMSATRADAEDLLQETFVGALGSLKRFNGSSSVKTWLTSILMRQAAKAWHRNRHHRKSRSIDAASSPSPGSSEPTAGSTLGASLAAGESFATPGGFSSDAGGPTVQSRVDLKMDLQAALNRLDPAYREILVLRELEQMSYDEIARSLGIPKGTVESRLFRARGELRRRMRQYAPD